LLRHAAHGVSQQMRSAYIDPDHPNALPGAKFRVLVNSSRSSMQYFADHAATGNTQAEELQSLMHRIIEYLNHYWSRVSLIPRGALHVKSFASQIFLPAQLAHRVEINITHNANLPIRPTTS